MYVSNVKRAHKHTPSAYISTCIHIYGYTCGAGDSEMVMVAPMAKDTREGNERRRKWWLFAFWSESRGNDSNSLIEFAVVFKIQAPAFWYGNGMCFLHHTIATTFSTPQFTSSFGALAIFAHGWCDRCRWMLIIMGMYSCSAVYTLLCNSIRSNISLTMFFEYFSSSSSSSISIGSFRSR